MLINMIQSWDKLKEERAEILQTLDNFEHAVKNHGNGSVFQDFDEDPKEKSDADLNGEKCTLG